MQSRYKARCKRRWKDRLARWALALVLVSPLLAWYGHALAAGAVPPRLQIVLVGPPPVADLLAAAIAPLLPATAPVDWRRVANDAAVAPTPAPPSGPRIWIDGRSPGTIQIVAFCRDAIPRVRTVNAPELTPVVAETVAQITRETVAALLAESQREGASNDEGPSAARPPTEEADATIAASANPAARPTHELLLAGGVIVRDEFGLNSAAATGVALSVLYPLRRVAAGSSARPFLALSLGMFSAYQLVAQEIIETTGISWQPLSFLDLSLGLGGGIQTASTNAIFVARGTASVGLRLGAGIEQILSATIDAGQAPQVSELWPTPTRVRPGVMIGLGWRPHW